MHYDTYGREEPHMTQVKRSMKSDQEIIAQAKKEWQAFIHDGMMDFADMPEISRADDENGAFVQTWVWVAFSEQREVCTNGRREI